MMGGARIRWKALRGNWGAKIISFVFALLLWLHVTAQQSESQSFRVPLVLSGIPDGLTVVHDYPNAVNVTIRGTKVELFKLRLFGRLSAEVDLSEAVEGRNTVPLGAAILNLPEQIDPREVAVDNPKVLVLNFEPIVTRTVPVRIAWKGELPRDVVFDGDPVVIPPRVQITGAASVVEAVESISTREIDIRGKRGRLTLETEVARKGPEITVSPDRVLVEVSIIKRLTRTLANIPPTLLQDTEGLNVEYSPQFVSLTIEGPEDLIRDIAASDVSVILNLTGRRPGRYRIEPEIIVPRGIDKYYLDIDAFEILVESVSPGER